MNARPIGPAPLHRLPADANLRATECRADRAPWGRAPAIRAASGLAALAQSASNVDEFLATWNGTGKDLAGAAQQLSRLVTTNEGAFQPALAHLRVVAQKLNQTLDSPTQDALRTGIHRFALASARLDSGLAEAAPFLKDIGQPTSAIPTTDFGQTLRRLNKITSEVGWTGRRSRPSTRFGS